MAVEPTCLVASLATRLCTRMVFVSPSATHGQKLVGLLGLWLRFHGADPPRFPFWLALGVAPWRSSLHAWWFHWRHACARGWCSFHPVLRMGKLVGLLGLWLCFHGADPPRFPFGSLWDGPMAVEPACLVVSLATRLCTRTVLRMG